MFGSISLIGVAKPNNDSSPHVKIIHTLDTNSTDGDSGGESGGDTGDNSDGDSGDGSDGDSGDGSGGDTGDGSDGDSSDGSDDHDSDHDGIDDDVEKAYEREVQVENEDNKFKISSELKNGTKKDKFEITFDVESDDSAEIKLKFKSEVNDTESELKYKVKFDKIVEFIDQGVPGIDNETILSTYDIGKAGWAPIVVTNDNTTGLIKINATTLDGIFSLIMRISNSFVKDNNVTLSPTSLKIDVLINNYQYNSTSSKLAIKTHVKTTSKIEIDKESEDEKEGIASNETELGVKMGNSTAFFSWSEFAIADGNTTAVIASTLADSSDEEGETSSRIFYTFNATDVQSIMWDPKVGVVSQASKENLPVNNPVDTTTPTDTNTTSNDTLSSDTTVNTEDLPTESLGDLPVPGFEIWVFISILSVAIIYKKKH